MLRRCPPSFEFGETWQHACTGSGPMNKLILIWSLEPCSPSRTYLCLCASYCCFSNEVGSSSLNNDTDVYCRKLFTIHFNTRCVHSPPIALHCGPLIQLCKNGRGHMTANSRAREDLASLLWPPPTSSHPSVFPAALW